MPGLRKIIKISKNSGVIHYQSQEKTISLTIVK